MAIVDNAEDIGFLDLLREAQAKLEAVEAFGRTFDRLGTGSHQQVNARYVYEELDRILKGGV